MEKQGNIQLGLGLKLEYGCDATAEMSEMSSHRERDINNNMQHNVESNSIMNTASKLETI